MVYLLNDFRQLEAHAVNYAVTDCDGCIDTKLSSICIHTARLRQGGNEAVVFLDAVVGKESKTE